MTVSGRHRLEPVLHARSRAAGRYLAAAAAVTVTLATVLIGMGFLTAPGVVRADGSTGGTARPSAPSDALQESTSASGTVSSFRQLPAPQRDSRALPAHSGQGRRVVFDISDQRVWLVRRDGSVLSTYLASGSRTDNNEPGHYRVFSRSRWAVGIDDSGVMQYFVRFEHGHNAAIGFHSIPTKDGHRLQTRAQLGTPTSHGCIRQALRDAIRMWHFAPVGTKVVVTR